MYEDAYCSEGADVILALDDIYHGNIRKGLIDGTVIVASFTAGKQTEKNSR